MTDRPEQATSKLVRFPRGRATLACLAIFFGSPPAARGEIPSANKCLALRQPNTAATIEVQSRILMSGLKIPVAVPDQSFWPQNTNSRKQRIGRVEVAYTLQPTGRADHCKVTRSSGFADLDEQSCRLIVKRLVLDPTKKGNVRVAERRLLAFAWLPNLNPNPAMRECTDGGGAIPVSPGRWRPAAYNRIRAHDENVYVKISVSWTGVPKSCSVVASHVDAETSELACKTIMANGWFLPREDERGNLTETVAKMVVFLQGATSYRKYPPFDPL